MESKVPCTVLCAGIVLLILAYVRGDAGAGVFIIFPFLYGTGILAFAGVLLIILSFFLFAFSLPFEKERAEKKTGGILLIGPLPVIFASDSDMAKMLVSIALGMMLLMFVLLIFFLFA